MAKWISFMSTLAACPSLSSTPSKSWQGPDLFSTGDLLTRHPFAVGSGLGSPLCSDPYESSSACSPGISVSLPTEMPSDAASANPGDTDHRVAQVPRTWGGCHPGAAVQKRGQGHSSGPLCPHDAHAGRMPLYHWLPPWGRVHRRTADHGSAREIGLGLWRCIPVHVAQASPPPSSPSLSHSAAHMARVSRRRTGAGDRQGSRFCEANSPHAHRLHQTVGAARRHRAILSRTIAVQVSHLR